jgi:hypothetical protein
MNINPIYKNWFVHNIFAHPVMQILNMIGLKRLANMVHDRTIPTNYLRQKAQDQK